MICQAEVVDIGLTGTGTDPFDATFLLAGTDPQGREIVVWIRLTPTMINDLIERLAEVLVAQQDILGANRQSTTDDVDTDDTERTILTPKMVGSSVSSTPWGSVT